MPTRLFTNCVVKACRQSTDALTTPARTILSKKLFIRASVIAPMPSLSASPESDDAMTASWRRPE